MAADTWSSRWVTAAVAGIAGPTPPAEVDPADPIAAFWFRPPVRILPPRTEDQGEDVRDSEPDPWVADRRQDRYEHHLYGT